MTVSGAVLLALAAVYFFGSPALLSAVVLSVFFHELGHVAALRLAGCRVMRVSLQLIGAELDWDRTLSYGQEIAVAAAGPLFSALLAGAAALFGARHDWELFYLISGVSAVYGVFNLLPLLPLDGGRIVYHAAALCTDPGRAERLACVTGCAVLLLVLTGGAALLIVTRVNFSLLLVGVWLLIAYCKRSGVRVKSKGIITRK